MDDLTKDLKERAEGILKTLKDNPEKIVKEELLLLSLTDAVYKCNDDELKINLEKQIAKLTKQDGKLTPESKELLTQAFLNTADEEFFKNIYSRNYNLKDYRCFVPKKEISLTKEACMKVWKDACEGSDAIMAYPEPELSSLSCYYAETKLKFAVKLYKKGLLDSSIKSDLLRTLKDYVHSVIFCFEATDEASCDIELVNAFLEIFPEYKEARVITNLMMAYLEQSPDEKNNYLQQAEEAFKTISWKDFSSMKLISNELEAFYTKNYTLPCEYLIDDDNDNRYSEYQEIFSPNLCYKCNGDEITDPDYTKILETNWGEGLSAYFDNIINMMEILEQIDEEKQHEFESKACLIIIGAYNLFKKYQQLSPQQSWSVLYYFKNKGIENIDEYFNTYSELDKKIHLGLFYWVRVSMPHYIFRTLACQKYEEATRYLAEFAPELNKKEAPTDFEITKRIPRFLTKKTSEEEFIKNHRKNIIELKLMFNLALKLLINRAKNIDLSNLPPMYEVNYTPNTMPDLLFK